MSIPQSKQLIEVGQSLKLKKDVLLENPENALTYCVTDVDILFTSELRVDLLSLMRTLRERQFILKDCSIQNVENPTFEQLQNQPELRLRFRELNSTERPQEEVKKRKPRKKEGHKRVKERVISEVIQKVREWRNLHEVGKQDQNGQIVKVNLEVAAAIVGISRKTLDDYHLQLRRAEKIGFNFTQNLNEKVGILRKFNKKHQELIMKMEENEKEHDEMPNLEVLNLPLNINQQQQETMPQLPSNSGYPVQSQFESFAQPQVQNFIPMQAPRTFPQPQNFQIQNNQPMQRLNNNFNFSQPMTDQQQELLKLQVIQEIQQSLEKQNYSKIGTADSLTFPDEKSTEEVSTLDTFDQKQKQDEPELFLNQFNLNFQEPEDNFNFIY